MTDAQLKELLNAASKPRESPPPKTDFKTETLRKGQFVKYGFTGGVAVAVHLREHSEGGEQSSVGTSLMPYVALLPFPLLIKGDVSEVYCAASWVGIGPAEAANSYATELAEARKAEGEPPINDSKEPELTGEDDMVFRYTGWNRKQPGTCYGPLYGLGLYGGLPLKFTSNGKGVNGDQTLSRDFLPLASFGLIWAPMTYFSLLGGFTWSNVKADDGKLHRVRSWTVGIGGNVDILPTIFSGK